MIPTMNNVHQKEQELFLKGNLTEYPMKVTDVVDLNDFCKDNSTTGLTETEETNTTFKQMLEDGAKSYISKG